MLTSNVKCYQLMADNYRQMGLSEQAIDCLDKASKLTARINTVDRSRLIRERQTLFELAHGEHVGQLKAQQLAYATRLNIFMAVLVILLLIIVGGVAYAYRRRQQLYQSIVRQNIDMVVRESQKDQQIEQLSQQLIAASAHHPSPSTLHPSPTPSSPRTDDIYNRLCLLMDQERLYTDGTLTRDTLAERLGTNRTYLTQIIKEKTAQSYTQFINSYRIQEAVRVLSDKGRQDYPLKQLCSDLGYSSMTTFYKLFQEKVGISPQPFVSRCKASANSLSDTISYVFGNLP